LLSKFIKPTLQLASRIGADPKDNDEQKLQKSLLVLGSFMFIFAGAFWGILYFFFGKTGAGAIPFSYATISFLSVVAFHISHRFNTFLFSQLLLILVLPFLLMITLGGFINSSGVILWALISPISALLFDKPHRATFWLGGYLCLLIVSGFLETHTQNTIPLPETLITILFVMNIGMVSSIIIALMGYFVTQKNLLFNLLKIEQTKSENLLLNILPKGIAARLKQGEVTIADNYESVSILFVDLVDFTPLSALCDPKTMVDKLGEIFLYFDQLVDKYKAEKVETVGDSYVIAAGLPIPRQDHAKIITQLALEIRTYFEQGVYLEHHRLNCRMGINSGPIMAGVIERKKISFNLWGDTINTASRMQSHGVPGQIQVSEDTYNLVKDDFICEPRGEIQIKGKGEMHVWLIISAKENN